MGGYECFDYWLHNVLSRRGRSGYFWSPLADHSTFDQQIQAIQPLLEPYGIRIEIASDGGGKERVFNGKSEVEAFMLGQPIGTEALVVGFDLSTQDNHAIYVRHGSGGMSSAESRGWTWSTYLVYVVT